MTDMSTGVLKKDVVKMAPGRRPGPVGPADEAAKATPRARIVGQTQTHAVLEVVCSCGQKIQVQCNYARPQ